MAEQTESVAQVVRSRWKVAFYGILIARDGAELLRGNALRECARFTGAYGLKYKDAYYSVARPTSRIQ